MRKINILVLFGLASIFSLTIVSAAVGDVIKVLGDADDPLPFSGVTTFCSVGLAFDGTDLYYNRCGDSNIYKISTANAALLGTFDTTGVDGFPNAMAFDATRNGIWFGMQSCRQILDAAGAVIGFEMPIYFWDFDDNSVTQMFTVPSSLINPATGASFLGFCFLDGLAFNANGAGVADDEIWFSDDVNTNLGLFRPDGTFVAGYDASTIDPSLALCSGLAIGGSNLYLANNGGGDVFRASLPALGLVDQFASGDTRQEDMECDPVTFATEVMWVRTTPQGGLFPDVITAYEIESGTCGVGGGETVCGDEIVEGIEQCDDGNNADGDGCSSQCTIESICGNNILENGEECDDGNTIDNDGCSASCLIELCPDLDGDGVCNDEDLCANSVEDDITLNPNQYAQNIDFGPFEVGPNDDQSIVYDMTTTQGCTCKQIAAELGVGKGHIKKGCSPSVMEAWTGISANPDRQAGIGKNIAIWIVGVSSMAYLAKRITKLN